MKFRTNRKGSRIPEAGLKMRLLSSLEGAPIIKEDFGEGRIVAHNYNGTLGLVRSGGDDASAKDDASLEVSE